MPKKRGRKRKHPKGYRKVTRKGKETSLFEAISIGDIKSQTKMRKKAKKGEVIRIM